MIVTILKAIGLALLVAVCFALLTGILFFIVAAIATANYRRSYGDQYDWDDDNQHEGEDYVD